MVLLQQLFMPTAAEDEEELESMNEQIEDLLRKEKATDNVITKGD